MYPIRNYMQQPQQRSETNLIRTDTGIILDTEKMEVVLSKPGLTPQGLLAAGDKLRKSFRAITQDWLESFFEEVKTEGYTDQELMEVVRKVVREETFTGYPPAIAKFLGHGRKIKLYTMNEIDKLVTERKAKYEHFGLIQRKEGKAPCAYFARRSDLAEHKIPEVQPRRIA